MIVVQGKMRSIYWRNFEESLSTNGGGEQNLVTGDGWRNMEVCKEGKVALHEYVMYWIGK